MGLAAETDDVQQLKAELARAWFEVERLKRVVEDQAKALAQITDDCPPHAPTIATLYWLYCPTRWHEPNWLKVWERLIPLANALGDLPAMKLTPLAWAEHASRRRERVKDTTLNIELARAKQLLKWAVEHRLIKYNPLQPAKRARTIEHRETRLRPAEIEKLLIAAEDIADSRCSDGNDDGWRSKATQALILCWHDSMMRAQEPLAIRRDRIGGDGRVQLYSAETKGRQQRVIYLTPRTLEAIEALPADPKSPFVFSRNGQRINDRTAYLWWKKARDSAGVDAYVAPGEVRVRRHDLRASGATTADEQGASMNALKDAMGHRRIVSTAKYCRSEQADNARAVAEKIRDATERRGPKKAGAKHATGKRNPAPQKYS